MNASTSINYSPEKMDTALAAFKLAYPVFESTRALDELRASEYARLDKQDQIYLDYTGGGLYAASQIRQHMAMLEVGVFGNPHSKNPTSLAMTLKLEYTPYDTLRDTA